MPIYMDRHDVSEYVTAEVVAQLHQQDLRVQDKYGCKGLTYWFDEKRKTAFCLIEAPNKQCIIDMHSEAHGDIPHQIIEVNASVVESFLGRIEDPLKTDVIHESAFRTIMFIGFSFPSFENANNDRWNIESCLALLPDVFKRFEGNIAKSGDNNLMVSFDSVTQAVWCAIEVHGKFYEWSKKVNCRNASIKTGISTGVPVTEDRPFFEEAIKLAKRLFYIANRRIVVSSDVKKLYKHENLDVFVDENLFLTLTPSDEDFISQLMNYMDETWQNPDLQVEDFEHHLGCSKSKLYRKLITLTNLSPNNFLKEYRLNKAMSLIKQQTSTISEIAFETGFNSPSYFAKCFHKKFGLSPSDYQQMVVG